MRFVILHYHLFKNAGSTVEDILDHSFGDRFATLETPVSGGVISNEEIVRYLDSHPELRAFSSHQIRHPLPQAAGYLFFDICFLRDPLDRLRSFYDYFRQRPNPEDPMSHLANESTLGDFVAGMIRDYPLFVRNNQVNLIACGGDSDEPGGQDLELAIHRVMASSFLGVVDCFGTSVAAGERALRSAFPELDFRRPPVNVSRGLEGSVSSRTEALREACSPEVFDELMRITALDRELVDRARKEIQRRLNRPESGPVVPGRRGFESAAPGITPTPPVGLIRRLSNLRSDWVELMRGSGKRLFDRVYYGSGQGLLHFLLSGAYEGRTPHPLFDTAFYLRKYPDVAAAGINPLVHYVRYGAAEGRKPHPLFNPDYYGVVDGNPLVRFLDSGATARNPHPLFDCPAYLEANPDALAGGQNPLLHYLSTHGTAGAQANDLVEAAAAISLDIHDIPLTVFLLGESAGHGLSQALWEGALSRASRHGLRGSVAVAWLDPDGAARWLAEPQQLPFCRAINIDQLRDRS